MQGKYSAAALGRLVLDRLFLFVRLGRAAARALGERRLDLLDSLGLGDALNRCDLAREPVKRGLIELALGVGLLGLALRAIEVADYLRDRDDVARVDLGLVLLGTARPHRALDAGAAFEGLESALDQRRLGELAHSDRSDLRRRHPQRHLVLDEVDD